MLPTVLLRASLLPFGRIQDTKPHSPQPPPSGVCLLSRNSGRLQGAPPPPLPRLRDVGVAGTEAANTGSLNRSPRRASDWSENRPVRGRGGARGNTHRSPRRAATPANQLSAPIRRLTNPKPHWRNECATGSPGSDSG